MAEPFLGEIRIMSFVFAPKGWALCNGQLLPINQNQALFALLGTNFGGDGRVNFALPDLRGRVPIHVGSSHTLGERGGQESQTLTLAQLPAHGHAIAAVTTGVADQQYPTSTTRPASGGSFAAFHQSANTAMDPGTILPTGGSQAHLNMQPFLTLSACIALQGIFPSPN